MTENPGVFIKTGSTAVKKTLVIGVFVLSGLYIASLYSYLLFHSLAEVFSSAVAFAVFLIAWNSRRFSENKYLLFVGISFLFAGSIGLVHMLSYKGMGVFRDYDANLSTQLWILMRYMVSITFLIAPVFLKRRLNAAYALWGYGLVTGVLLALIFLRIFPDCYIEGAGLTPFKKISEYVISAIFIASLSLLHKRRDYFDKKVLWLLSASILLSVLAELSFTFYISVFGFINFLGHIFIISSFYLMYKALVETTLTMPYNLLFRELTAERDKADSAVAESTREVEDMMRRISVQNTLLRLFTRRISRKEYLDAAVKHISSWSGCRHAGIRLLEDSGNIPYESYVGFDPEFMQLEGCLSIKKDMCACIRVIAEKPDREDSPFMTPGGSFYLNEAVKFAGGLSEDRKGRFRGVCVKRGFNSIAIVPIRYQGKMLGAMHLADEKEGAAPLKVIEFLESISPIIGEVIHRFGIEMAVAKRTEELKAVNAEIEQEIVVRRQAEEALKEQSRLLDAFFKHSILPMAFLDRDFNFLRVNEAYAKACDKEIWDFPGHNHFEFYPHEENEAIFRKVVAAKEPFITFAKPFVFPDHPEWGVTYWDWTLTPILEESGEVDFLVFSLNDVTEQKKLGEQLRQAQKMEAVGHLAGGIAHDFNNRLAAITNYVYLLKTKLKDGDPNAAVIDQILATTERAAGLTQSLLTFSRKQSVDLRPVGLNGVIMKVQRLLESVIGEDIKLETSIPEEEVVVMADSGQLEQVLINLATNARDAMPEGGHLSISSSVIDIPDEVEAGGGMLHGRYALVSVTDTGAGMDEETRQRIFEPFFTTKEIGRGTGLGLSMVYSIIKQHGGRINVYSEPASGSTFRIYLPLAESPAMVETEAVEDPMAPKGGKETVLLAEDDPDVRRPARDILEKFGYRVIEAVDGVDAVKKFKKSKGSVDLVILDVIMPKKNGREACEEIAKIKPSVKVIFTSGYTADVIHRKKLLKEGMTFISKPVSPGELLRKIREVLDK